MGKLNQLSGVANNLADSIVSVTNIDFLHYLESLPAEKTKLLEINLLDVSIEPKEIDTEIVTKVIRNYKKWFLAEIKKLNIELSDIEKVSIRIAYKPGKSFGGYYACNTTIKAKGKEYTKKVKSSYG
jgi:hypothetical protein